MKKWIVQSLAVAILGCGAGWANAQSINDLEGEWTLTGGTLNGETVSRSKLDQMSLKVTGGNFTAKSGSSTSGGNVSIGVEGTYRLNFAINSGVDAGKIVKAMYRLDNGSLTITYSQNDQFPEGFESNSGNKYCTLIYRKGGGVAATTGAPQIQNFGGSSGTGAANAVAD